MFFFVDLPNPSEGDEEGDEEEDEERDEEGDEEGETLLNGNIYFQLKCSILYRVMSIFLIVSTGGGS